jgi:predicted GH43/DUF377 family glycosyl hydrolase
LIDLCIERTEHRLQPNARRVLAKPFMVGEETLLPGASRAGLLIDRILAIPEAQVRSINLDIRTRFGSRHRDFTQLLEARYERVENSIPAGSSVSAERRQLIGAYFTHEYSIEAAALFNPSLVLSPDQSGLAADTSRFVMSLRAVGEGHLSSIEFRTGTLDGKANVAFDAVGTELVSAEKAWKDPIDKARFRSKLLELGAINELSNAVLDELDSRFLTESLLSILREIESRGPSHAIWYETAKIMRVLVASNYTATFPANSQISERVIFPAGPNETRGMEDARFVRFTANDGSITYYATYTAYDGFEIWPQLIETQDFTQFTISTLTGTAAQNKGMALFPRPIDGRFVMLSRKDRENLHLSTSDDVHEWNNVTELYRPQAPWELLQVGNCGSPIETDAGWLVLTHGVGPMRRYCMGALLLDIGNPGRVIGHLKEPLLEPDESEREGYVPNVLYSCGAIVHAGQLIVPYGFSDYGVAIARLPLSRLLEALLSNPDLKR